VSGKLEKLGALQPSRATHYSHPIVIPKPNKKWRVVLDYMNLNRVTTSESCSWPIPNIQDMIYRIGASRGEVPCLDFLYYSKRGVQVALLPRNILPER